MATEGTTFRASRRFEVRQRHRGRADLLPLLATHWDLADASRLAGLGLAQPAMGHACEWKLR